MGKNAVVVFCFFEDHDGQTITVNSPQYIGMLRRRFISAMRRKKAVDMNTVVFQQDQAPPHYSQWTLE